MLCDWCHAEELGEKLSTVALSTAIPGDIAIIYTICYSCRFNLNYVIMKIVNFHQE